MRALRLEREDLHACAAREFLDDLIASEETEVDRLIEIYKRAQEALDESERLY